MPTHTEAQSGEADILHLDAPGGGKWVSGPNAHWQLVGDAIGNGKGFSRAALARHIVAHHESLHGSDNTSHAEADEWGNAGRRHSQTTFHKALPGEVKRYLEGNPAARHLFGVTQDSAKAGGADALSDLGEDKYFAHVDRMHGSTLNAALDAARNSPDPEMQFAAKIHDHMTGDEASALRGQAQSLSGKAKKAKQAGDAAKAERLAKRAGELREQAKTATKDDFGSVDAGKLKVGQRFTFKGEEFRVVEDEDGHKVLHGFGEDFPVEALKSVPVDRGSLKTARAPRAKRDDVAPFSGAGSATDALWLHNPAAALADADAAAGRPTESFGQPIKYGWADALVCGDYTHPSTGQKFTIDRKRLDNAVLTFSRLQANGVRPPIVEDHQEEAGKALGWVAGARRRGDTLQLLHALVGTDAHLKAARNLVSVKLCGTFTDARRNKYTDAITHSALTPVPVIPGQQGFIAASSGPVTSPNATNGNVPDVFILAAPSTQRRSAMAFTPEQINQIRQLPGAPEVTEENAAEFVLSYATTTAQNVVTLRSRAEEAESRLAATEADVLRLSAASPKTPDPEALDALAEADEAGIDALVSSRRLAPGAAGKLKLALIGSGNRRNAVCLSRALSGTDVRLSRAVIDALKDNVPTPDTGDATGAQVQLSMLADPKKGTDDDKDAKAVQAKMIEMANGKPGKGTGMAKMCKGD